MTARDRVRRVQRILLLGAATSALAWGALAGLAVLAIAATADLISPLGLAARSLLPRTAALAALVAAAAVVRRAHRARQLDRVALWIEERAPALRYALVTRLDLPAADSANRPLAEALDRQVDAVPFEPVAWRAARHALAIPAAAAVVAVLLLLALPRGVVARVAAPHAGDAVARAAAKDNALAAIVVTVEPPAYTGLAPQVLDDPAHAAGVTGSRVRIEGRVAGGPVRATADTVTIPVTTGGDRWRAALAMPAAPAVVRLRQRSRERLLLLEPHPDSSPVVTLVKPARDTVLRAASGVLPLHATFRDDFGLAEGWWEFVVSSGEGENFKFRTIVLGRAGFGNARSAERGLRLRLDSLALEPGDLVHLRAVARDGNTVTGPGESGSDTRSIRIARPSEYDSVSVEALPPPDALKGLISQRMLILLAEALEKRRPRISHETLVDESGRIARDQNALRKQVSDIIFARLDDASGGEESEGEAEKRKDMSPDELLAAASAATDKSGTGALDFAGGESPVVAINRPMLEAYNAMWEAGRALGIGEPKRALPHMYAALAAIQRARLAERIYLRGKPKDVVVDLAKVRLVGKREGIGPAARLPRTSEDAVMARRAARFDAAIERLGTARAAAVDSLLLLRAELLAAAPAVATPLGDAIDALRAGRDATAPLVAARRALAGAPVAHTGLSRWGGAR